MGEKSPEIKEKMMKIRKNVPLMTTDNLDAQKKFYGKHFGFRPTFEGDTYLGLISEDGACEIAFMKPMGCCASAASGAGLTFCLEVDDVDLEYNRLEKAGMAFVQPPKDNPWGDRSAIALDPIGISVYIYKPIPPSPEFAGQFKE
jgi:predicted enzyme related to lactoylglutathione lyase